MPSGMMRMSKAKSGRKIDAIVALALALREMAVKPESWGHLSWNHTTTAAEKAQALRGGTAVQHNVDGRGTSLAPVCRRR
jgi:hypothetical protein